jgi:small subunit ribosomal protein S13
MARISGIDLPPNKRIDVALTYIYGIGQTSSRRILDKAGINPAVKVKDLSEGQSQKISKVIQDEEITVEGELRREISTNLKRLQDIGSYRGARHRRNLPVRGQRTRTNARTRKGPRRAAIASKKKATKK